MIKTDNKGNVVACITTKEDLDYTNFDLETIDYYDNFLIPSYEQEIERLKNDIKRITNICNEKIKIINDVREYIEPMVELDNDIMIKGKMLKPALEMLDKVGDKE